MPKRRKSYRRSTSTKRRFGYRRRSSSYGRRSWKGRRSYGRYRLTRMLVRQPTVVADRLQIKFKTQISWSVTTSASTGGDTIVIQANSIADPLLSAGTAQPYGFDQWAAFYNRYFVSAAKITLRMLPGASTTEDIIYGVFPSANSGFTETDFSTRDLMELPYVKVRVMGHQTATPQTLTNYMTSYKISGGQLTISELTGIGTIATSGATSPTSPWLFNLRAWNQWNPSQIATGRCTIMLTQYVTLFRRVDIIESNQ
ncbi:capsid protein [Amazon milk frog associated circular DNA virus]|nr:capsid protein [Amazon milk frog associated circular DNA virus]